MKLILQQKLLLALLVLRRNKKKKEQINAKIRQMYLLIDCNSILNLYKKRQNYLTILKPTWTYGILIWRYAKVTNEKTIQTTENTIIRMLVFDKQLLIKVHTMAVTLSFSANFAKNTKVLYSVILLFLRITL